MTASGCTDIYAVPMIHCKAYSFKPETLRTLVVLASMLNDCDLRAHASARPLLMISFAHTSYSHRKTLVSNTCTCLAPAL